MTIQSAKASKKELAERPFRPRDFMNGRQFRIMENLQTTMNPRVVKVLGKNNSKPYEMVAVRVADGIFEKDIHLFESEWLQLSSALPDTLMTLKDVVFAIRKKDEFSYEFQYVGVIPNTFQQQTAPAQQYVPPQPQPTTDNGPAGKVVEGLRRAPEGLGDNPFMNLVFTTVSNTADALALIDRLKREGKIANLDGIWKAT